LTESTAKPFFLIGVLLCLVGSLASLQVRVQTESRNRTYALAMDVNDIRAGLTDTKPETLTTALSELKAKGLDLLIVTEETLRERFERGEKIDRSAVVPPFLGDPLAFPDGFNPQVIGSARTAGVPILVRLTNFSGASPEWNESRLQAAIAAGAIGYLPQGDEVLGFRDSVRLIEHLKNGELFYATPEFTNIAGDSGIVREVPERVIRLHSIQAAEMSRASRGTILERYAKAFGERGIRIMLVRPFERTSENFLADLGKDLSSIGAAISKEKGKRGVPRPYPDYEVPRWTAFALGLGLICATIGLAYALPLNRPLTIALILAGAAMGLASALGPGRQYGALFGALLFPIAGFVFTEPLWSRRPVVSFALISACSVVGGLFVAGLLNGLPFMVKAAVFTGVKPAHFLPLFLLGVWAVARHYDGRELLKKPLTVAMLGTGFIALAIVAVMLVRTGNDSPGAVSGLELSLRSLLERVLVVRPRTKEFMLGHPALLVGLLLFAWNHAQSKNYKGLALALIVAGAIGQTSIVNTMCHLHTPVLVSVVRIAIGLVLGGVLGLVAWFMVRPFLTRNKEVPA